MSLVMAVVYETVDEEGLHSYIAKLYGLPEVKSYSMLARGPRWTHKDIAVLVQYRDDLEKAARLLGRTREACKKQLQRLGLSLGGTIEKNSGVVVMVFPRSQIDLRRTVVKQVMPRLKKLLAKVDKADDLAPENINDLAKIVRAIAALFNAMEKWQTGMEMLEIWRGEIEEDAE